MLRKVPPHDLAGACAQCGMTLGELSERTGIPERELLLFSLGAIGLKATDRFAILEELASSSKDMGAASSMDVRRRLLFLAITPDLTPEMTLAAFRQLRGEADDEDEEENPESWRDR